MHPRRTLSAVLSDGQMLRYGMMSYLFYGFYYTAFVAYGYIILNNAGFQYNTYYPSYPSPYFWEAFTVLPLFLAQLMVLALVTYGGAKLLKGQGTFRKTFGILGLAMFVPQLVAFAIVDTPNILLMPQSIVEFARLGDPTQNVSIWGAPGSPLRQIADSYFYIAILWALVVSAIAVSKVHKISFWKVLPFAVLGMIWIAPVIALTKNYFILLW